MCLGVWRTLVNKMENLNVGYGKAKISGAYKGLGKVFVVSDSNCASYNLNANLIRPDRDGVLRLHSTIASALGSCVTGRGDVILIDPGFTTAPTAANLAEADTKGVLMYGSEPESCGLMTAYRPSATLPATTTVNLFTITGNVRIVSIVGIVTTVVQTQSCNTKLVLGATDICANLDITAAAVGSRFTITGTFGNAMINTEVLVPLAKQATEIITGANLLKLTTGATNTGAVRWIVQYVPIDKGAKILAA